MSEEAEEKLTPEELKKRRDNAIKFYQDQNEVLKLQSEFEKHQADIAENQAKTMLYRIKIATMAMGPKQEAEEEGKGLNIREEATGQAKVEETKTT